MKVSVVYALSERQVVRELEVPDTATLAIAVELSGLLRELPEINPESAAFGIYGRLASLESELQPGDRVEIYRSLKLEPKQARRNRAGKH